MKPVLPTLKYKPAINWHFSSDKNAVSRPVISIVHNFLGSEDQFLKHVQLLNSLGYDAITFDLSWHKNGKPSVFWHRARKHWAIEIKDVLCEILEKREVIGFSFSGLGACSLDAVALLNENEFKKVRAMIFDSGPFDEGEECVRNMLKFYYLIKNKTTVTFLSKLLMLGWDYNNTETTQKRFEKILELNPNLPLLSLQGKVDRIVPFKYIHDCFQRSGAKNFKEVLFEAGGHLTSYKEEPEKYKDVLRKFLAQLN